MEGTTEGRAIEMLNALKLTPDVNEKIRLVQQLIEPVVRTDGAKLLDEFLPEIVQLQRDPSPGVRKAALAFLATACQEAPRPFVVSEAAACVEVMASDEASSVAKQALQTCGTVMRIGLALFARQPRDAAAESAWRAAFGAFKGADVAASRHSHDGVRMSYVKLVESTVFLFTFQYAPTLSSQEQSRASLPEPRVLANEAQLLLGKLFELLRGGGSGGTVVAGTASAAAAAQPSPGRASVTMVALQSVSNIAVHRPNLMPKVLTVLLTLASEGAYTVSGGDSNGAEERSGSSVSVGNALRSGLVAIVKTRAPESIPWRQRIYEALRALGASQAADAAAKWIERLEFSDARKRDREVTAATTAVPATAATAAAAPPSGAGTADASGSVRPRDPTPDEPMAAFKRLDPRNKRPRPSTTSAAERYPPLATPALVPPAGQPSVAPGIHETAMLLLQQLQQQQQQVGAAQPLAPHQLVPTPQHESLLLPSRLPSAAAVLPQNALVLPPQATAGPAWFTGLAAHDPAVAAELPACVSPADLLQVQRLVATLLLNDDRAGLDLLVDKLPAPVLAELVMVNMEFLPDELPSHFLPSPLPPAVPPSGIPPVSHPPGPLPPPPPAPLTAGHHPSAGNLPPPPPPLHRQPPSGPHPSSAPRPRDFPMSSRSRGGIMFPGGAPPPPPAELLWGEPPPPRLRHVQPPPPESAWGPPPQHPLQFPPRTPTPPPGGFFPRLSGSLPPSYHLGPPGVPPGVPPELQYAPQYSMPGRGPPGLPLVRPPMASGPPPVGTLPMGAPQLPAPPPLAHHAMAFPATGPGVGHPRPIPPPAPPPGSPPPQHPVPPSAPASSSASEPRHMTAGRTARPADLPPARVHASRSVVAAARPPPLAPLPLVVQDSARMSASAARRLLVSAGLVPDLEPARLSVLARLAAKATPEANIGELLLQHILSSITSSTAAASGVSAAGRPAAAATASGVTQALCWLNALFIECSLPAILVNLHMPTTNPPAITAAAAAAAAAGGAGGIDTEGAPEQSGVAVADGVETLNIDGMDLEMFDVPGSSLYEMNSDTGEDTFMQYEDMGDEPVLPALPVMQSVLPKNVEASASPKLEPAVLPVLPSMLPSVSEVKEEGTGLSLGGERDERGVEAAVAHGGAGQDDTALAGVKVDGTGGTLLGAAGSSATAMELEGDATGSGHGGDSVGHGTAGGTSGTPADIMERGDQTGIAGRDGGGGSGDGDGSAVASVAAGVDVEVAAPPADMSGTMYEDVLMALLWGLRDHAQDSASPAASALTELLLEAPALPAEPVAALLQDMLASPGDAATLALKCAWSLISQRPLLRDGVMQLVLAAATGPDPDTRSKAVRLVANRLMIQDAALGDATEQYAVAALQRLKVPPTAPDAPPTATNGTASAEGGDVMAGQQDGGGAGIAQAAVGDAAAAASGATQGDEGAVVAVKSEPGEGAAAVVTLPPPPPLPEITEEDGMRYCSLYMAITVRRNALLPGLVATYAAAPQPVRLAIEKASGALARALGNLNASLLALLVGPPAGTERLLMHMLQVLTDAALPSAPLVAACRQWFASSSNIQVLAPVAFVLPKAEVLSLLPRLIHMPTASLKALYKRLATPHHNVEPLFGAAELLVGLHNIGLVSKAHPEGVTLKVLSTAVDVALQSPETFPQSMVAQAIEMMEARSPLPTLFMRTVISALKKLPTMRQFVMDLLCRLIAKNIWQEREQWQGFLVLANSQPGRSIFPVLLQLPASVLQRITAPQPAAPAGGAPAQRGLEPRVALDLARFAKSAENPIKLTSQVQALLTAILDDYNRREAASAAAREAAAAAIAAKEAALAAKAEAGGIKREPIKSEVVKSEAVRVKAEPGVVGRRHEGGTVAPAGGRGAAGAGAVRGGALCAPGPAQADNEQLAGRYPVSDALVGGAGVALSGLGSGTSVGMTLGASAGAGQSGGHGGRAGGSGTVAEPAYTAAGETGQVADVPVGRQQVEVGVVMPFGGTLDTGMDDGDDSFTLDFGDD